MALPTYERRFFLGLLTKDVQERQEKMEEMKEKQQTSSGNGKKTTRVSGAQLKNRIKSGDLPIN